MDVMSEVPNATAAREVRAGGTIRFAVGSPTGLRSSTWRIWSAKHTKTCILRRDPLQASRRSACTSATAGRTPSSRTRGRSPLSRRARLVMWTSGQRHQVSARAGVGGTASLCRPPTCGLGRRSNQVISRSRRPPASVTGFTSKWSSLRWEPPPAWSSMRCTSSGACLWWMGVRLRSSLGGCGRPAMRRASSPSPANRHLRRSPRCRTPGFSCGQRRTCAWAYSAARATERASGRTSPLCHLRQERPPFVRAIQSKCPPMQAPSLAGASGRAVLYSPQSRAAPDTSHRPLSHPGLVHVWSTIHRRRAVRSGLQRYIVRPGRRGDPAKMGPGGEP
jgi:hypothetical protein